MSSFQFLKSHHANSCLYFMSCWRHHLTQETFPDVPSLGLALLLLGVPSAPWDLYCPLSLSHERTDVWIDWALMEVHDIDQMSSGFKSVGCWLRFIPSAPGVATDRLLHVSLWNAKPWMSLPPPLSMSYVPGMVLCSGEASGQDRHGPFLCRPHNPMGGRDWWSGDRGKQLGNDRTEVRTMMLVSANFGETRNIFLEKKQLIFKASV